MTDTYFIFYVKDQYLSLTKKYPLFLKYIYNDCLNSFYTKQNEEIFEPIITKNVDLMNYLNKRSDYIYHNKVYYINNKITDEIINIKINEYCLEVTERKGKTVIYDVLSQYCKNFYMIMS